MTIETELAKLERFADEKQAEARELSRMAMVASKLYSDAIVKAATLRVRISLRGMKIEPVTKPEKLKLATPRKKK